MELTIADCKRIIFWYHVAFQTQELSPEGEQETDLRFLPELQVDIQDFEKNHGKIDQQFALGKQTPLFLPTWSPIAPQRAPKNHQNPQKCLPGGHF